MTRAKISIGLTVLCGVFSALAAPAFAEFESQAKASDKGTGEVLQLKIHEGSNSIICEATEEEGVSKVGWTVEKEGKQVKNASGVNVNIENWGKCSDVIGTEKFATKIGECEIEMMQSGKESEISGKIVKTCTVSIAEGCEVKIVPQQLKVFEIASNGGNEEKEEEEGKENNTGVSLGLSSVTTEAKSCGVLGIKGGKTATVEGVWQLKEVANGAGPLTFRRPAGTNGNFNERSASNQTSPLLFTFAGPEGRTRFECRKGKFTGSIGTTPAASIDVTPAYEECEEAERRARGRVTVTGCSYRYRLISRENPTSPIFLGSLLLTGRSCEIRLTTDAAPICEVIIRGQEPEHIAVVFKNERTELEIFNTVGQLTFEVRVPTGCNGFRAMEIGIFSALQGALKLERVNTP